MPEANWNTIANLASACTLMATLVIALIRGGKWWGELTSWRNRVTEQLEDFAGELGSVKQTVGDVRDSVSAVSGKVARIEGHLGLNGAHRAGD